MPFETAVSPLEGEHCIDLAINFPFPESSSFPRSAGEFLEAELTAGCPLCPHCNWRAGHIIEDIDRRCSSHSDLSPAFDPALKATATFTSAKVQ